MYCCQYIMRNYTDVVWIGQPGVNEQLVSRETPGSTILTQWYERATHHWVGVQSVRHTKESAYRASNTSRGRRRECATHQGVGVRACDTSRGRRTSVRHITGSAYERATHHGVDVGETSGRDGASVTSQCRMWTEIAT